MSDVTTTVHAIYAAFGRGDVPAILAVLDQHVAWEAWDDNHAAVAGVPWMQPRTGPSGAGAFFAVIGAGLQIHDFRVRSVMVGHGEAAVEVEIDATVVTTGRRYRDEEIHVWTFNDAGKVVRFRHYLDTAKHIWAAGVADARRGV